MFSAGSRRYFGEVLGLVGEMHLEVFVEMAAPSPKRTWLFDTMGGLRTFSTRRMRGLSRGRQQKTNGHAPFRTHPKTKHMLLSKKGI